MLKLTTINRIKLAEKKSVNQLDSVVETRGVLGWYQFKHFLNYVKINLKSVYITRYASNIFDCIKLPL